jgi:hypothetical protein
VGYLPARRCQRVAFNIFLCFFLRMRLRRFLINDPMTARKLADKEGATFHIGLTRPDLGLRYRHRRPIRGSSNGKTSGFGPENRGSIPLPRANFLVANLY